MPLVSYYVYPFTEITFTRVFYGIIGDVFTARLRHAQKTN